MPDLGLPKHRAVLATWLARLHSELAGHPLGDTLPERAVNDALMTLHKSRDGLLTGMWNRDVGHPVGTSCVAWRDIWMLWSRFARDRWGSIGASYHHRAR